MTANKKPPLLVLGLGNPLLGDDAVGWMAAAQVKERLGDLADKVEVDCLAVGGLRLMERLVGYEQVILIDAVATGNEPPGTLYQLSMNDLPNLNFGHMSSSHDTSLQTALALGRQLDLPLPEAITIVGIEAQQIFDFSETLTPDVATALPELVSEVVKLLPRIVKRSDLYDFA